MKCYCDDTVCYNCYTKYGSIEAARAARAGVMTEAEYRAARSEMIIPPEPDWRQAVAPDMTEVRYTSKDWIEIAGRDVLCCVPAEQARDAITGQGGASEMIITIRRYEDQVRHVLGMESRGDEVRRKLAERKAKQSPQISVDHGDGDW